MAAGAQPHSSGSASQRRVLRYQVQAPLDVTVLRQGIPHTLPGRSLNLCERGLAAVLAGEVLPGEAVGLELRLPLASTSLRTRALVRHHDKLRCGMEFLGLTVEQEALLRQWVKQAKPEPERASAQKTPELPETAPDVPNPENSTQSIPIERDSNPPPEKNRVLGWIFLLALLAILLAVCWWRWSRGWQEIESGLDTQNAEQPQVQVPAEVMEKLVIHRVDPDYPDAARQAQLEGVVVLDVVVGRDGSVVNMHPVSGPEVFTRAAMDALRWWRFEPYRVDGKPVVAETTVAVEFNP